MKDSRLFRIGHSNFDKLEDVIGEISLYNGLRLHFDSPLVDESYYIPNSEVAKTVDRLKTNSNVQGYYDFGDGNVSFDASVLAEVRKPGLDMAELSSKVRKLEGSMIDSMGKDLEDAAYNSAKAKLKAEADKVAADSALTQKIKDTVSSK